MTRSPRFFSRWIRAIALCGALHLWSVVAAAAVPDENQFLQRLERYLNQIRTVESEFVQVSSTGDIAEGTLYVSRPGRMRVDYAPPNRALIIASGRFLIFHDRALEQVTHIPIQSTPVALLLDERIQLQGGDIKVESVHQSGEIIRLRVVKASSPADGSLTLVFKDEPLTLVQWEISDPQGVNTTVTFKNARFGGKLAADLFDFRDPTFFEDRFNQ